MLKPAEQGCLVIADISGYTGLLAASELEHAQDALRDLMQTVVGQLRPGFRLAKLEGDAAFAYALSERLDGQHLLDTLERAYFAFHRRLGAIARATTCDCNACLRIPTLDLKILAHHGSFVRERMFGTEELTGTDVVVVHRLLKNAVTAALGLTGYLLLTDACAIAAGLDPASLGLSALVEAIDGVGDVTCWIEDLGAAWIREQQLRRVRISERETVARLELDLPLPPSGAWRYLTAPELRVRWQPNVVSVDQELAFGRQGTGTVNHCVHGDGATLEEILDWRPFDYFTLRSTIPRAGAIVSSDELTEVAAGTHVLIRFQRPKTARDRAMLEQMGPFLLESYRSALDQLRAVVAADLAADPHGSPGEATAYLDAQG